MIAALPIVVPLIVRRPSHTIRSTVKENTDGAIKTHVFKMIAAYGAMTIKGLRPYASDSFPKVGFKQNSIAAVTLVHVDKYHATCE